MIRNRQDAMTLRHMVTIPSLLRFSYIPVLVLIVLLAIMVSARPSDGAQDAGPATLVAAGNKVNLELMEENDGQAIWTPAAAAELAEALASLEVSLEWSEKDQRLWVRRRNQSWPLTPRVEPSPTPVPTSSNSSASGAARAASPPNASPGSRPVAQPRVDDNPLVAGPAGPLWPERTDRVKAYMLSGALRLRAGRPELDLVMLARILDLRFSRNANTNTCYLDPIVHSLSLAPQGKGYLLVLEATGPLDARTFPLSSPSRLVIDLPNAYLYTAEKQIKHPAIGTIRFDQFAKNPNIMRVVVPLGSRFDVALTPPRDPQVMSIRLEPPEARFADQPFPRQDIVAVRAEDRPGGMVLRIDATGPVRYEWHRLKDPDNRFFIDFPYTVLRGKKREIKSRDSMIRIIRVSQFQVKPIPVTRVVVELTRPVDCLIAPSSTNRHQVVVRTSHDRIDPDQISYIGSGFTSLPPALTGSGGVVCIDAGHGGGDVGCVNRNLGVYEKDITMDIARRLRDLFRSQGWSVIMTRETDRDVSYAGSSAVEELSARSEAANRAQARIFISIHCNASVDPSARGTSTHWNKGVDYPLAVAIQESLMAQLGRPNRGVQRNRFYVLVHTRMPAVLVETAFLSNPAEGRLLADPDFRQQAAEAIMDGVNLYRQQQARKH